MTREISYTEILLANSQVRLGLAARSAAYADKNTFMNIFIGILLAIALLIFSIYSGIAIKHAARFRYLSSRTVYLTLIYVGACSILVLAALSTYLALVLK